MWSGEEKLGFGFKTSFSELSQTPLCTAYSTVIERDWFELWWASGSGYIEAPREASTNSEFVIFHGALEEVFWIKLSIWASSYAKLRKSIIRFALWQSKGKDVGIWKHSCYRRWEATSKRLDGNGQAKAKEKQTAWRKWLGCMSLLGGFSIRRREHPPGKDHRHVSRGERKTMDNSISIISHHTAGP